MMDIRTVKEANITIISISGRLDALSAPAFEVGLNQWLELNESSLVVDFGSVDYISSAGLRVLLSVAKNMKARNGKLVLARLQNDVKHVFEISGFTAIFPIFETIGAALKAAR